MSTMASQITTLMIVYSTVYSGADQRKPQRSASLAFERGIHRWPVNSPHKWPVTRKMFPFDDVIMKRRHASQWVAATMAMSIAGRHVSVKSSQIIGSLIIPTAKKTSNMPLYTTTRPLLFGSVLFCIIQYWPGPFFCVLFGVSSDYAQPITGQVIEVTCPVIGQLSTAWAYSEQETENGHRASIYK